MFMINTDFVPSKENSQYMKPDPSALKNLLKKRAQELQKIIRQMKQDNLESSKVCKNLEEELDTVKGRLEQKDAD